MEGLVSVGVAVYNIHLGKANLWPQSSLNSALDVRNALTEPRRIDFFGSELRLREAPQRCL